MPTPATALQMKISIGDRVYYEGAPEIDTAHGVVVPTTYEVCSCCPDAVQVRWDNDPEVQGRLISASRLVKEAHEATT